MSKKFTYTKITGHYYCQHSDDWEEDGVEFDYEVEDSKLLPEIVDLIFDDYFKDDKVVCENEELKKSVKEKLAKIIDENYLVEQLADQYEDTLKDIFHDEAIDCYND